jgi:hypothetical protein
VMLRRVAALVVLCLLAATTAATPHVLGSVDVSCPSQGGWTRLASPQEVTLEQYRRQQIPGTTSVALVGQGRRKLYATSTAHGLMTSDDCGCSWIRAPAPRGWSGWSGLKDVLTDQTTLLFTFYHGPHQISRDGGLSLSLGAGGATGVQPAATSRGRLCHIHAIRTRRNGRGRALARRRRHLGVDEWLAELASHCTWRHQRLDLRFWPDENTL